jgi:hypothetical protein
MAQFEDSQGNYLSWTDAARLAITHWAETVRSESATDAEIADAARPVRELLTQKGIEWLQEKWGAESECPYCGQTEWAVGTAFGDLLERGEAELSLTFPVVCDNCGNTVQIDVLRSGVVPLVLTSELTAGRLDATRPSD